MKVAIMMLSFERFETLSATLPVNMKHAGEADLFVLDQGSTDPRILPLLKQYAKQVYTVPANVGIARGFNFLLKTCYDLGYDYFQFMANDISEPAGWIERKLEAMQAVENSGMVSVPLEEHGYCSRVINGKWVCPGHVIGQFIISWKTYEAVGALREDFGHYGPIDLDYNVRCERLGLINYYVRGIRAIHLDDRKNDLYGYDKSEMVKGSWGAYTDNLKRYNDPAACYIPNGEYTINADQYFSTEPAVVVE